MERLDVPLREEGPLMFGVSGLGADLVLALPVAFRLGLGDVRGGRLLELEEFFESRATVCLSSAIFFC